MMMGNASSTTRRPNPTTQAGCYDWHRINKNLWSWIIDEVVLEVVVVVVVVEVVSVLLTEVEVVVVEEVTVMHSIVVS